MMTARSVAFHVLTQIHQKRAFTNLALQNALRDQTLSVRDKALCTEIVYGTVQRERTLDLWIAALSKKPLRDLDPRILTILRMTVYQLTFLDKIPAYAALNEAVNLAKSCLPVAGGFVNGVLRTFIRQNLTLEMRLEQLKSGSSSRADELGRIHSFPTWLVEQWISTFGYARAEQILQASNRKSELTLRLNPLRTSLDKLQASILEATGTSGTPSPVWPDGVRITRGMDIETFPPYQRGEVSVQDDGAMLIAPLLVPRQNLRIVDMCAAPGTKSMQIAEMQGDLGQIDAYDVHVQKVKTIRAAAHRLGITSVTSRLGDARFLADDDTLCGRYDAILLDAPCSGFGVLSHRPDIRWHRMPSDLSKLQDLQRSLLKTAFQLVRKGGYIVYSTCTLLAPENQDLVRSVVDEYSEQLVWDDVRSDLPECVRDYTGPDGRDLTLTPELFGTDGFYMARLRRV